MNVRLLLILALFAFPVFFGGCGKTTEPGGSGDADADSDTDTDSDSDADTDTTPQNPCDTGYHAECYGADPWCVDDEGVPVSQLDTCEGGELCVALSDEYAECQCVPQSYQECFNGDVWWYDSCGELGANAAMCGDATCVNIDAATADCCTAESYQQCGVDGRIHWFSACELHGDQEGATVGDPCVDNADCVNTSPTTAECQCRNHWSGATCEDCPLNWDDAQDCGVCTGSWTGTDCDTCAGFGDNCQCPNDTYAPQPGSRLCWTCQNLLPATAGVCTTNNWDTYTWAEAEAMIPPGFRMPLLAETLALLDNCTPVLGGTNCDSCADSTICGSMMNDNPSIVWMADPCAADSANTATLSGVASSTISIVGCHEKSLTSRTIFVK